MDELEFRRRILAEPSTIDKELEAFAEQDKDKQAFIDDVRALDDELSNALKIPVPENLAKRIIDNTYAAEEAPSEQPLDTIIEAKSRFAFNRLYLAAAASFLVAISVFFVTNKQHTLYSVGEHAFAHLYHEIGSLDKHEAIDLAYVNEKFATIGGHLDELPGKVTYLMFCDFQGKKGLHLVFESDFGPMTVFIVPSDEQPFGTGSDDFNDERFAGHINRGERADTILIASIGAPLDSYNSMINDAIRWLH
ncbi:DUF3379 family protein [Pseudoalteromonas shioyasakiensis]|uniref:DUF3379 family protein n=1 Tax=Pseudoalteromonas shioyasakiensis TaxID=1190813 RepID=UPI00209606A0|nr:DUF3379 family protein [Pseudoalteromonas shioyasakiensis]MCO6354293.1 DUF3379 family protein [Pseudoalteromonas shioyasakiensis]